jgi:hypothetical protein
MITFSIDIPDNLGVIGIILLDKHRYCQGIAKIGRINSFPAKGIDERVQANSSLGKVRI